MNKLLMPAPPIVHDKRIVLYIRTSLRMYNNTCLYVYNIHIYYTSPPYFNVQIVSTLLTFYGHRRTRYNVTLSVYVRDKIYTWYIYEQYTKHHTILYIYAYTKLLQGVKHFNRKKIMSTYLYTRCSIIFLT